MASLPALTGLTIDEINELINERPGSFRGAQIFKWVYQGVTSFDEMTNVSKELRAQLTEKATIYTTSISQTLKDPDGTVKLQITLHDGGCIETVLLTDAEGRKTACVSCQVGCPMGCAFCQTGTLGFARNLTA
ncbi:MAG: 23S rRNA (adenine(2503)-C2)-methyltransferase, partial [Treponemataceae bacterium]|nr:23S rRNA (adenine(2503)-C2)-methyltransferase [Treponemataceae bacterium]